MPACVSATCTTVKIADVEIATGHAPPSARAGVEKVLVRARVPVAPNGSSILGFVRRVGRKEEDHHGQRQGPLGQRCEPPRRAAATHGRADPVMSICCGTATCRRSIAEGVAGSAATRPRGRTPGSSRRVHSTVQACRHRSRLGPEAARRERCTRRRMRSRCFSAATFRNAGARARSA